MDYSFVKLRDDRSEKVQYNSPEYPVYVSRGLLSDCPDYTFPSHWHDDIELIAVLSGEMKYHVNEDVVVLKSGMGILVNARRIHFGFSDTATECDYLCVLLHPSLLCPTASYEQNFIAPFTGAGSPSFLLLDGETSWQRDIYRKILFLYQHRNAPAAPLKALSAFSAIWALLCEHVTPDPASRPQDSNQAIIKNMLRFIQQNYDAAISLADIAASGAVGQSKCCKLFASYFGQSPIAYLNFYRLVKSAELLRHSGLAISEIALLTGFNGSSYFAESFRKWAGKSPGEYRKEQENATAGNRPKKSR